MKKYKFYFTGRQAGAIGIFYQISETYQAKDIHEALSLLYEDYEHIQGLTIREDDKPIKRPDQIKWVLVRSYRERERSPIYGTYKLLREDAPIDYKY